MRNSLIHKPARRFGPRKPFPCPFASFHEIGGVPTFARNGQPNERDDRHRKHERTREEQTRAGTPKPSRRVHECPEAGPHWIAHAAALAGV